MFVLNKRIEEECYWYDVFFCGIGSCFVLGFLFKKVW